MRSIQVELASTTVGFLGFWQALDGTLQVPCRCRLLVSTGCVDVGIGCSGRGTMTQHLSVAFPTNAFPTNLHLIYRVWRAEIESLEIKTEQGIGSGFHFISRPFCPLLKFSRSAFLPPEYPVGRAILSSMVVSSSMVACARGRNIGLDSMNTVIRVLKCNETKCCM